MYQKNFKQTPFRNCICIIDIQLQKFRNIRNAMLSYTDISEQIIRYRPDIREAKFQLYASKLDVAACIGRWGEGVSD